MSEKIKRYLPEEVPNHLFTQNKLNQMGLAATSQHVAFVYYPEQKREYKLFNLECTRKRNQQKGFSLVIKDKMIKEILEVRRRELEIRKQQFCKEG